MSRLVITLQALILALVSWSCLAQQPPNVTEAEWAQLPEYCPDKIKNYAVWGIEGRRASHWISVMGGRENWVHMHHYCWALIEFLRAGKPETSKMLRNTYLNNAVGNINYVIGNARPDFKLLPELLTKKASALVKLGRDGDAAAAFRQAADAKPDYWPAFAGLAEIYRRLGQLNEARAVVEEGLEHAPQSKLLSSMLAELQKSGAKSAPHKRESAKTTEPSKTPEPPPQNDPPSPQQDQPEQQDPSLTK